MNKSFKIALIVLLSLLLISFSGLFIVLLNSSKVNGFSFNLDFAEEQNLAFDKEYNNDYSNIKVNSNIGDVKFIKSENDNFSVKLYAESDKDFSIKENNNELIINYEYESNKIVIFGINKTPRIEVYVPSNYSGKLDIKSNTGDVKVDSFDVDVVAKLNTGDIKVGNVKSYDVTTDTGDVKLTSAKSANIVTTTGDVKVGSANTLSIKSKTGDIKVDSISGDIQISSGTGDVFVEKLNITKNSSITSNTGDILINSTNEIYVEVKTNTGDTKINNNYRDAKYELKLKTSTGDIKINN